MRLESATVEQLITEYEIAAALHGDAFRQGNINTSNRAAEEVATIYRELRQRADDAGLALLPLLLSRHLKVRGWAAAHALEFAPEKGRPVLEALSTEEGMTGFSAQMTLDAWQKGQLCFP